MRRSYVMTIPILVIGGVLSLLWGKSCEVREPLPTPNTEHVQVPDEASSLLERELANEQKIFGPDHPEKAMRLNELASWYFVQKDFMHAESLLKEALAIMKRTGEAEHSNTARVLNSLAMLYVYQEKYADAERLIEEAKTIWRKVPGPEPSGMAMALGIEAMLYQSQGKYTDVEPILRRARSILEKASAPEDPDMDVALYNLAMVHYAQRSDTEAERLFRRVLALRKSELGPADYRTVAINTILVSFLHSMGNSPEALSILREVLEVYKAKYGPVHHETAKALANLASEYMFQDSYTEAEPLLKKALGIMKQAGKVEHPDTAGILNNLGILYQHQGEDEKALQLFQEAVAIQKKAFVGPEHPDWDKYLENLAALHVDEGHYEEAEKVFKQLLDIQEHKLGHDHPSRRETLRRRAHTRARLKPDQQAVEWLHQSAKSRSRYVTENLPFLTTRQQQQFLAKYPMEEDGYLWHLLTHVQNIDRAGAYQTTLWTKQLLAETARNKGEVFERLLAEAPEEWKYLWRTRNSLRRIYATQALNELSDRKTFLRNELDSAATPSQKLAIRLEEIEEDLVRRYPAYAKALVLEDITVVQVQQALKPDQVLLEYVRFHPYDAQTKQLAKTWHYGVYVVRGGTADIVTVDIGEAATIDAAIHDCQIAIQEMVQPFNEKIDPSHAKIRKSEAKLAQASSILRRLIWQPVEHSLTNVTRVYVAPDGPLSLFPFEALAQQRKPGPWQERYVAPNSLLNLLSCEGLVRQWEPEPWLEQYVVPNGQFSPKKECGPWQYLTEERELVYLNTGRDLARLAHTAEPVASAKPVPRTAVLIGNPKFDARPKEIAQVVAGLLSAVPIRPASFATGSGATLGATTSRDGVHIPRDWTQYLELDTLLTRADQQLHRTGWTVTTWRDQQVTEPAVLGLQAPRILQFATHGYLLERATPEKTGSWENPLLQSMLLLAGANYATPEQTVFYRVGESLLTEEEAQQRQLSSEALQQARIDIGDGILTAYEVSGMNLHGTELVNLTACKTGLGTVTPEGIAGLRQAFIFAGARALTTSLWEVPVSEATQQIEDFYARWLGGAEGKSGMTRYAAFRQTQLTALAQARKTYGAGHPFFWAGFIYLGDPGDLAPPNPGMQKVASQN